MFEANEEALGSLHKDSKWDQQLKDFRDSNVVLDRLFEMKMKRAKSNNASGWVSHSADSQGQGLADSQGHSKMMDAEACANHHLPGPGGDGDQEPQRRGGRGRPGEWAGREGQGMQSSCSAGHQDSTLHWAWWRSEGR